MCWSWCLPFVMVKGEPLGHAGADQYLEDASSSLLYLGGRRGLEDILVIQPPSSPKYASPLDSGNIWAGINVSSERESVRLNQHLQARTFFCVSKNDYFCEQETRADTCTLTTARNKRDMKRGKSPQGKDHRVKVIGVKDQGSVLLAWEPEDKVLSSLLLKVWVALAGLALSFHSCSAFSLPVWHFWAHAVSHCVAPGTEQPRFWIVSHVGATMVVFSWQKSCDKERWRSKFIVFLETWGRSVPMVFPGVGGYFFAPSSHLWRGLSNWKWLHTGAAYKNNAKLTSFGVLLK